MKEVSSNKTQRVKVTQYEPLYLLSTKKQVDSERKDTNVGLPCRQGHSRTEQSHTTP